MGKPLTIVASQGTGHALWSLTQCSLNLSEFHATGQSDAGFADRCGMEQRSIGAARKEALGDLKLLPPGHRIGNHFAIGVFEDAAGSDAAGQASHLNRVFTQQVADV